MVMVKLLEDNNFLSKCATDQLTCPQFFFQGTKIPIYCFGTQSLVDNVVFGGLPPMSGKEQSLLDSLLLAQWEDQMWKGHFKYDVTASQVKVISGRKEFLAQFNGDWGSDSLQYPEEHEICHQEDPFVFDWMKDCDELLFGITSSDKAYSELISSAALPNDAILIISNVRPIEYGHVFLVPRGFNSLYQVLDARSLEMAIRVAVEINNLSFHLFCNCSRPNASHLYFQACYFPDLLSVERMPVDTLFEDDQGGIRISSVTDYPIKTLLFESNCNVKILVEVLAEICSLLPDKNIPYNLLISNCGKKMFLFFQLETLSTSCSLSAWECGGYFLFTSRQEFDQATEAVLLKRLSAFSLDDGGFAAMKQLCCSIANKFVI